MSKKKDLRKATLLSAAIILFLSTVSGILSFEKLHAEGDTTKTQTEVKNISVKQSSDVIDKGTDVFILDVRTREEYHDAHIKGANLIPLQELEQNINKIPKNKTVVVYCARGKRSANACEILKDKGLKELYNVEGGINQWKSEGFPVEKP